jgi:hypothetical protein
VRPIIRLTLASLAIVAVACGKKGTPTTAMSDDLKQDLKLATTQPTIVQIAADELAPQAQKEIALKPKRNPAGSKVIRSPKPTVKASPKPVEVAEVKAVVPEVQVTAAAPSESDSPAPSAPPMARPTPVPVPSAPAGQSAGSDNGQGQGGGIGGTIGGILGGILGGIARGGVVVGDDDHCDPRGAGRRGGGTAGPVYIPSPGGRVGADPRGMPRTRFPINPIGIGGRRR